MASQPELIKDSRKPYRDLKDSFRELLKELGTPDVDQAVTLALERGLIPDFVRMKSMRRGLCEICRNAWTERTEGGLPFAQPLDDGERPRWKQRILFSCEEAIDLLRRKSKAIDCGIAEFRLLEQDYRTRFGDAIPEFRFA